MAVPRARKGRSATIAAALSFVFPGAGQAYARRWRAALAFGLPAVAGLVVLATELNQGVSHLAARMFDPRVALTVLLVIVVLGTWRVIAVVHAWRITERTPTAWLALPLLIAVIVGTHGFAFVSTAAMLDAGDRIASGGDGLLEPAVQVPGPTASDAGTPAEPTATPAATPPGTVGYNPLPEDDPYYEPEDDPEPEIVEGSPPPFDVAAIDTQTDGWLNVLIVGIDWKPGRDSSRTDTMIVVSTNTQTGDVYMFSFPRDIAQVPMYSGGTYSGKLNTFAGYAQRNPDTFPDGGMKSLGYQLGYLLGIPIDYYAAVDIPGFEKVVKAVGGVTVNNEKDIADYYMNNRKGFFLKAGEHRLDAQQTLAYVRSRHGSSDFARARRQQQVLAALRKEMTRPEKLANLPGVIDSVSEVLRTDFPRDRLADLISLSEQVSDEPTASYVFRQPTWASFTPRSVTGHRSLTTLRVDKLRELSIEIFGERSLYNR
ncbi:hypothetical protein BH23CHL7_BH23CHL7_12530 [soil metagenome]